jgi:hypothetical protein
VRRELLHLVLAVVLLHAVFLGGSYLLPLERGSRPLRLGYTAVWTALTLLIVLRGLHRIRSLRARAHRGIPRG